ncbi:hypothetical protein CEE45_05835 [Candidatus Heimdallarchaeota archaeon B3_Heim]|nr:MAG: hypothetical protein CEE45_05835 [Candidatus Heimdallarchaeota archaeon B3_Heim]
MSRLKKFLRRNKQDNSSPDDHKVAEEEKPVTPTRGIRRYLSTFSLYYPLGVYQRALDWSLEDQHFVAEESRSKRIVLEEKPFKTRFRYLLVRTIIQSVSLSIVFTAPISLPWLFNVVLPFSIDLLPFGIAALIRSIINSFLDLLSPFEFIVDAIHVFSNLTATYNPMYFYGSTYFLLNALGLIDVDIPTMMAGSSFEGSSMSEFLAASYLTKFAAIKEIITPLLVIISSAIAFFLVFRRARTVLFEIQGEKEESKNIAKFKRKLLGYYLDEGYTEIIYSKNRVADSKTLRRIGWVSKWGPLFAFVIPILLALVFVF